MILRFMHGWGFDAGFWDGIAGLLPEWSIERDDRGYFGAPLGFGQTGSCVVVAHSFGAMRALAAPPAECRGLIAINGFDRFTPGVSPRIVDRMIAKFVDDPHRVLADFRRRVGDGRAFGPLDLERLGEDLTALRDGDYSAEALAWPLPLLSLQGAHDPLLPAAMRDAVFADTPLLERMTHAAAGHLLPVEDAPYCARAIRAFVEHLG